MAASSRAIVLPRMVCDMLGSFTDAQLGELFRAVCQYDEQGEEVDLSGNIPGQMLFTTVLRPWLDAQKAKYEKMLSDAVRAGLASARKRKAATHARRKTSTQAKADLASQVEVEVLQEESEQAEAPSVAVEQTGSEVEAASVEAEPTLEEIPLEEAVTVTAEGKQVVAPAVSSVPQVAMQETLALESDAKLPAPSYDSAKRKSQRPSRKSKRRDGPLASIAQQVVNRLFIRTTGRSAPSGMEDASPPVQVLPSHSYESLTAPTPPKKVANCFQVRQKLLALHYPGGSDYLQLLLAIERSGRGEQLVEDVANYLAQQAKAPPEARNYPPLAELIEGCGLRVAENADCGERGVVRA